jgi:hypothetical protein
MALRGWTVKVAPAPIQVLNRSPDRKKQANRNIQLVRVLF